MTKKILVNNLLGSVLLMVALTTTRPVKAGICEDSIRSLMPCVPFLLGSGSEPGASCCSAAQRLNNIASTPEIRRELCACFKQAAAYAEIDADRAKMIPRACKIQVSVPIDPKVDCNRIK